MFLGTYTPKLDEKGRFFLPAKFREELDEGLVITRGQEHCLAVYPMSTFVEMTREIAKGSVSVKKVRDYQRMLAAGASDTAADKQGRVMVPPAMPGWERRSSSSARSLDSRSGTPPGGRSTPLLRRLISLR